MSWWFCKSVDSSPESVVVYSSVFVYARKVFVNRRSREGFCTTHVASGHTIGDFASLS